MLKIYTLNAEVMNYRFELVRLHEFVREIHSYYMLTNQVFAEQLVLSKAMVSFAMSGLNDSELDDLIELLKNDGFILSTVDNTLSFPVSFIEADC